MAIKRWTGSVSGDAQVAGNWNGGVPADGDEIHIIDTSVSLTNVDLRTVADVDPLTLFVGGTFNGSIGDTTNALKLDTFTGTGNIARIDASGDSSQVINLDFTACTTCVITNTGSHSHACYFSDGGYTDMFIFGGQSIRLGAGVTITNLRIAQMRGKSVPQIVIEQGAAITNLYAQAGVIQSYAALSTVRLTGSTVLQQLGSSAGNIASLSVGGNARCYLQGSGAFTVTAAETFDNGLIDSASNASRPWTFTNATLLGGLMTAKAIDLFTNDAQEAGGRLDWQGTRKVIVPAGQF